MGRNCEECGYKMPAFHTRMRHPETGKLLCPGCHPDGKGQPSMPQGMWGKSAALTDDRWGDLTPISESEGGGWTDESGRIHAKCQGCGAPTPAGDEDYCGGSECQNITGHTHEGMRKGAPFAGYEDFDACVAANGDKDDPEAYCATIMRNVEGVSRRVAAYGDDAFQEAVRQGLMIGTSEFTNPGAMLPSSVYVVLEPGPNGGRPTDRKTSDRDEANRWAQELLDQFPKGFPRQARLVHVLSAQGFHVVAHDSGDGQTIYHCPFCGGGNVIARSDKTTECGYCNTAFTVQVQPVHSNMPQTDPITGEPLANPDMPGEPGVAGEVPPDMAGEDAKQDGIFEPPGAAAPSFIPPKQAPGGGEKPAGLPAAASRRYVTAKGVALDEDAFMRHMAIAHAADREKVIEQVRASRT